MQIEDLIKKGAKRGLLEFLADRLRLEIVSVPRILTYDEAVLEADSKGGKVIMRVDNPQQWNGFRGTFPTSTATSAHDVEVLHRILTEHLGDLSKDKISKVQGYGGIKSPHFDLGFFPELEKHLTVVGYDAQRILDSSTLLLQPELEGRGVMVSEHGEDALMITKTSGNWDPKFPDQCFVTPDKWVWPDLYEQETSAGELPRFIEEYYPDAKMYSKVIQVRDVLRKTLLDAEIISSDDLLEYELVVQKETDEETYNFHLTQVRYLAKDKKAGWKGTEETEKLYSTKIPFGKTPRDGICLPVVDFQAVANRAYHEGNFLEAMLEMDQEGGDYCLLGANDYVSVIPYQKGDFKKSIHYHKIRGILQGRLPNKKAEIIQPSNAHGYSVLLAESPGVTFVARENQIEEIKRKIRFGERGEVSVRVFANSTEGYLTK